MDLSSKAIHWSDKQLAVIFYAHFNILVALTFKHFQHLRMILWNPTLVAKNIYPWDLKRFLHPLLLHPIEEGRNRLKCSNMYKCSKYLVQKTIAPTMLLYSISLYLMQYRDHKKATSYWLYSSFSSNTGRSSWVLWTCSFYTYIFFILLFISAKPSSSLFLSHSSSRRKKALLKILHYIVFYVIIKYLYAVFH